MLICKEKILILDIKLNLFLVHEIHSMMIVVFKAQRTFCTWMVQINFDIEWRHYHWMTSFHEKIDMTQICYSGLDFLRFHILLIILILHFSLGRVNTIFWFRRHSINCDNWVLSCNDEWWLITNESDSTKSTKYLTGSFESSYWFEGDLYSKLLLHPNNLIISGRRWSHLNQTV